MAHKVVVVVPLPAERTMALLVQAATALHHQVLSVDAAQRRAEIGVDFDFRSFATFRILAEAVERSESETTLRLAIRPGSRLTPWTGFRQSQRVGWRLVGKMQEILDPERYHSS
jgi:hypothetical protein